MDMNGKTNPEIVPLFAITAVRFSLNSAMSAYTDMCALIPMFLITGRLITTTVTILICLIYK